MSSIWNPQDRFILSNMTSEKLYTKSPLTTGVSGTSAYIGLEPSATYNETVLWSGSQAAVSAALSEPITNFETIKLFTNNKGDGAQIFEYEAKNGYYIILKEAGNNQPVMQLVKFQMSGDVISATNSIGMLYNNWSSTSFSVRIDQDKGFVQKVVGINRKEV